MIELLTTGRIVDLVLALMAAEWLVLFAYGRRTGRGIPGLALATNLLAGACLLLALRAALTGARQEWLAACLLAAWVAHVFDLRSRWRHAPGVRGGPDSMRPGRQFIDTASPRRDRGTGEPTDNRHYIV